MNTQLAAPGFADRLVPRFPAAQASSQADRAAASSGSSPDGAAFRFTESCSDAMRQADTAPEAWGQVSGAVLHPAPGVAAPDAGDTAPSTPTDGAVALSEASCFILSLIAAHEGRSERDILAALIAAAGHAIGLSALVRRGADDIEDLADLPGYARKAANRFRSGGP